MPHLPRAERARIGPGSRPGSCTGEGGHGTLHGPTTARSMSNPRPPEPSTGRALSLYRDALAGLQKRRSPFLVGGTFAFVHYTGVVRPTKDLDLFVRLEERDRVLDDLRQLGWRTRVAFPHWLAKAERGPHAIDVIHSSGNGVAVVDAEWLDH